MAQRCFVTGGAGCIGSHMVDELIRRGCEVTVYDNFCSGRHAFIAHHRDSPKFTLVEADLHDRTRLESAIADHDTVFHFAANPDIAAAMADPGIDMREGTTLTFHVLEAMRLQGVRKIVYSSGSGVYGDVGSFPTSERFGPLLPISTYGASKLACEGLISAYCHMFGMSACMFRFANVVGERQTHGVAYDFIRKLRSDPNQLEILGDGRQSKSYIHVSDILDAMLRVLNESTDRVNLYNIATDDYLSVREIADTVVDEMGLSNVNYRFTGGERGWKGDVPVVRFDLTAIHEFGWRAQLTSAEAMRRSVREMLGKV